MTIRARFYFGMTSALLLSALLLLLPSLAEAISVPEKLTYNLTWTGVRAGTATQEITADRTSVRIVSTARSAEWIDMFYPIQDRIETTLFRSDLATLGPPQHYRMKISEGKHRRDKEIQFNQADRKAFYTDHLSGERAVVPITDKTYDVYSSFYYIRFLPLEVGKSVFLSILDGKEVRTLEVQVLRKEKVKTVLGSFQTFVLKPLVRKEGVFENKGDVLLWISDDSRRLPVKIQAKVAIGSIIGTLVTAQ